MSARVSGKGSPFSFLDLGQGQRKRVFRSVERLPIGIPFGPRAIAAGDLRREAFLGLPELSAEGVDFPLQSSRVIVGCGQSLVEGVASPL